MTVLCNCIIPTLCLSSVMSSMMAGLMECVHTWILQGFTKHPEQIRGQRCLTVVLEPVSQALRVNTSLH